MTVRIIGGGLTGILAAFEAHRMGYSDIVLSERFDALGGVALPKTAFGLELRDGCVYFGPQGDAIRTILEDHGCQFEDFENRFCSVAPGGAVAEDFGGPALACGDLTLGAFEGQSLAGRLGAYPAAIGLTLRRYCEWHLGTDALDTVHESAAIPLAINRVYPAGCDIAALAERKAADPLYDELYGIPRALWGHCRNVQASLPKGGFKRMFEHCRRELVKLGIEVRDTALVSPRQALAEHRAGDLLVWAANPTPLFKPMGLKTPALLKKNFATYVFKVDWKNTQPFYLQNFTATGSVFRLYLYETGGEILLTAECVTECGDRDLRDEICRLLATAGYGEAMLNQQIAHNVAPRWIYHSIESLEGLKALRAAFTARMGPEFVAGAWEPYAKSEKLAEVNAALAACAPRRASAVA